LAPTYAGFTACRTLQGFFNTAPQVIGLTIIHDMFFFHERTRKINVWAFSFLVGPYLGPFISGFLIQKINWRQDFGVMAGFHGFAILLIILFGDETLYDREHPENNTITTGILGKIQLLTCFAGISAKGRPALKTVFEDLIALSYLPHLILPCSIFLLVIYMWAIGITTSVTQFAKPPPYLLTDTAVALLYFAPMIGVLTAEVWGHFLNDWLQNNYIKRHNGVYKPENRLFGCWPAVVMSVASLVLYGQTLQHSLPWAGIAVGWGMNSFAMLTATTAISAYVLDCFPRHAALASSWVNFWRVVGKYIQPNCEQKSANI
jgi:MFS family permease